MESHAWEERYRSRERPEEDFATAPVPLLAQTAKQLPPGWALDLACGTGRNALWLARQGWKVTAVDGAPTAIKILQRRASLGGLAVDARVADLDRGEYQIDPSAWDLICISYYLQRDLFESAKQGLAPGGVLIRTAATAVCHTYLSIYTGEHPGVKYPVVMGHEATGVVEATGENVTRLKRGQHVLINPIIA